MRIGNIQALIDKYYEEEMAVIRAKPLWEQFDGPMRAALRYRAKERAQRRAIKEQAQSDMEVI